MKQHECDGCKYFDAESICEKRKSDLSCYCVTEPTKSYTSTMGLIKNCEIMKASKTLYLPIKQEWIKMILSFVKREDYRTMTEYWRKRLYNKDGTPRDYRFICFHNYKTAWWFSFDGIDIGEGNVRWGAPAGENVYRIKIGKFIEECEYGN